MYCEGHWILRLMVKGRIGVHREHDENRLSNNVWRLA